MTPALRFRFDLEKLANVLAYFAARGVADLTTLKAAKLLYLADRAHLLQHGRPITGDRYIAMDLGPVPEGAYQLISRLVAGDEIDDKPKARLSRTLEVYRGRWSTLKYPILRLRRGAQLDADVFSESEVAVLDRTVREFGDMPARSLVDLTHSHEAYRLADANRAPGSSTDLPYELLLREAESDAVRQRAAAEQEDRDFVEALKTAGRSAVSRATATTSR